MFTARGTFASGKVPNTASVISCATFRQLRKSGKNGVGSAADLGTNLSPERSRRSRKSLSKNFQISPNCGRKKSENSARLASPPVSLKGKRGASVLFQVSQTSAFQRSDSAPCSALNTPA